MVFASGSSSKRVLAVSLDGSLDGGMSRCSSLSHRPALYHPSARSDGSTQSPRNVHTTRLLTLPVDDEHMMRLGSASLPCRPSGRVVKSMLEGGGGLALDGISLGKRLSKGTGC